MPTAAKFVAALCFAAVGYLMAEAFKPLMPEGSYFGQISLIVAGIGLLCGWIIMGPLAGKGYTDSMGYGVRTAVTVLVWSVIIFGIYIMVRRSMQMRYDGPMEAIIGIFEVILEHGRLMGDAKFIGTIIVGGIVGGTLTEFAAKRWT